MAAGKLIGFGSGALFGMGIGTAIAVLYAPQDGQTLRTRVGDRIKLAKIAGIEAQAETERDLIKRYRQKVGDGTALYDLEKDSTTRRLEQIRQWTESAAADPTLQSPEHGNDAR